MNWMIVVAAGCLVTACDEPPRSDTLVVSSDPELRQIVSELLPLLMPRTGLELLHPVRVERRSREQLAAYLQAKLDEELPPDEERHLTRSYALLGLVPGEMDLRSLLLSLYTEQVPGFYDPDSTSLFILDDEPPEALSTVLVHELVHALQDQAANLDSLTAKERGNDAQTAAQAAIEGHATLVMLEYMMEQIQGRPLDLSQMDGFADQLRPALQAIRAQYPALAQAPLVIQESLLFPYVEGAGFVQHIWREGRRLAPFGEWLPQSTEQILHPERFVGGARDDPRDLHLSVEQARVLYTDGLGELETGLMLQELVGFVEGPAATGWDGDRFALLETSTGEALLWVSVWDEASDRDRFADRLAPGLPGLPLAATLERVDLGGTPALVLRLGDVGEVGIEVVLRPNGGTTEHGESAGPIGGGP